LSIRRAVTGDELELARLRANSAFERHGGDAAAREDYERVCAEFFRTQLARDDSFLRSWLAFAGDAVAGGASLTLFPTLPRYGADFRGLDGRVRDVYVLPAFRRRGIARALLAEILLDAQRTGLDRLTLGTSEAGRPLYESIGFVLKDDEMVYEPR
jgi:GNAT superfamily N-acetyltransferase